MVTEDVPLVNSGGPIAAASRLTPLRLQAGPGL
jgi:hypothetical protein